MSRIIVPEYLDAVMIYPVTTDAFDSPHVESMTYRLTPHLSKVAAQIMDSPFSDEILEIHEKTGQRRYLGVRHFSKMTDTDVGGVISESRFRQVANAINKLVGYGIVGWGSQGAYAQQVTETQAVIGVGLYTDICIDEAELNAYLGNTCFPGEALLTDSDWSNL